MYEVDLVLAACMAIEGKSRTYNRHNGDGADLIEAGIKKFN